MNKPNKPQPRAQIYISREARRLLDELVKCFDRQPGAKCTRSAILEWVIRQELERMKDQD